MFNCSNILTKLHALRRFSFRSVALEGAANKALTRKVFCTVHAAELDNIIEEVKKETISGALAASKIMEMRRKLDEHVVSRKPVPNTPPSDRNKKCIALNIALLGSPPTALAPSDAVRMNLPRSVSNPEKILISKKCLGNVLYRLGILSNVTECDEIQAINFLWQVSQNRDLQLVEEIQESTTASVSQTTYSSVVACTKISAGNVMELLEDAVELGVLKATFGNMLHLQRLYCLLSFARENIRK